MSETKLFVLKGGEQIVSRADQKGKEWHLFRPFRIILIPMPQMHPNGQMQVSMIQHLHPFLHATTSNSIVLTPADLLGGEPLSPTKPLEDAYLQGSSGLQIAH